MACDGQAKGIWTDLSLDRPYNLAATYGPISAYTLGDALGTGNQAGTLRTVTRDAAGRITGYSHINNGVAQTSLDQGFGYDNLNRLLSASLGGSSTQYSYDETGNRTSKTIAGTTYSNTVASTSNRLTQTQDVPGTATLQYDAAGHITNDGTNSFTYSDRGRMTSATNAGGTVSYLYNGYSQRVYKSGPTAMVNTGAAYFLYDEQGQLLGEYDANGAPVYETIYLGAMPVGVLKQAGSAANSDIQTTMYNVHADHIATARVITQQDQAIVWRWDTAEAFGGTVPDQNPGGLGTFVYNQRFPGQVFDQETGLFQNWNREYNARQGRYIQSDPIGLAGGINTFAYVGGNPLSLVDPLGLQAGGGGGPYHPPEGVGTKCTDADTCPEIQGKLQVLKRMIDSHEGWDRHVPSPRGGGRHAAEIADLWRAYARCQAAWNKKDCDNCKPESSFLDWLNRMLGPKVQYDPVEDREVVVPNRPVTPFFLPGPGRMFLQ